MALVNYVQMGETIAYYNAGSAISYGDVVVIGDSIGIAMENIAALATGSVRLEGVFKFPAPNTLAMAIGDTVYWDVADQQVNKTAISNTYCGVVVEAKTETATYAYVKLGSEESKIAANQADSEATTVAGLLADFNALLAKLKAANLMAQDS